MSVVAPPAGVAAWCEVCCTRHVARAACHGRLLATGPERHGRRVAVNVGARIEVFGVLIAEAGDVWRARVLTYPNMLWSVPGGRGTMKFVGRSAQEAEEQAFEFVREFCRRRAFEILDDATNPDAGSLDHERATGRPRGASDERVPRHTTVRYGRDKPNIRAQTADLSPGGLFVVTDDPLRTGTLLRLALEIDGFTIPLCGRVAWTRPRQKAGRPPGMGVELSNPPAMYVRRVQESDGVDRPDGHAD